jgi:putative phosphoesterase
MAIIADVHSNLQALASVVSEIEKAGPDVVVCAGDTVGYGANPNECCQVTRKICVQSVLGNHEISVLTGNTISMNRYAAAAVTWTSQVLTDESTRYLASLGEESKFKLGGTSVAIHHGSVGNLFEYVYEEDLHDDLLARASADILVLGHTHVPYVRKFPSGLIVNPGSVGQPRDGDNRASFAVLDTDQRICDIHRVQYDVEKAYECILSAGLPAYLAERLLLGR